MTTTIIISIVAAILMVAVGFILGTRGKSGQQGDNAVLLDNLRSQLANQDQKMKQQEQALSAQQETIRNLTADRDVQKAHADSFREQLTSQKDDYEQRLRSQKEEADATLKSEREEQQRRHNELREGYDKQLAELKDAYEKQLAQTKDGTEKQIEALRLMNKEQVDSQMKLIRQQMQTTSEEVLKRRQDELGERNKEQVSKIIDPLQQSLKEMQEAFNLSKSQQSEALTRLDETIKINMQKSAELGETADRLTRALTGEVKVQGNFGELKLKQLLEDMDLKEGEQFDTQETDRKSTR